ncbi:hypothetical protein [Halorientalis salina]|uniref:hypothetical protein n=1 Tax=Halorientalis salina TaxID=2932266 RepID=UPI0010ABF0B6|nr:hypothetical protein [Halorientalis salina]
MRLIPFCDTPLQSLLVATGGGIAGGFSGLALGLGPAGTALLAGALAGLGDVSAHLVRGDEQFRAALGHVRQVLGGSPSEPR